MGFQKGRAKTGGRQKGTPNFKTIRSNEVIGRRSHTPIGKDIQAVLDELLTRVDVLTKIEQLLVCDDNRVAAHVLLRLLEYRFGKPQERLEVTGQLDVRGVIAQARARALAQRTAGSLTDGSIIDAEVVPENPPEIETQ